MIARVFLALLLAGDALVILPSTPLDPGCAWAAGASHAALVVEHGDGRVLRYCVGFSGPSVTGEQLLQLAHQEFGLEYAVVHFSQYGDGVCQIDYEPTSYPPSCFAGGPYWDMFVSRGGGAWTGSNLGASSQTFGNGDAEGWHWTSANSYPPTSPAGVCSSTPPPAAATPVPTRAPASNPAALPAPVVATPATQATSTPTSVPTPSPSPSVSPSAPAARAGPRPPATGGGASLALATAAAGAGAMLGLALLRLLAPRIGR